MQKYTHPARLAKTASTKTDRKDAPFAIQLAGSNQWSRESAADENGRVNIHIDDRTPQSKHVLFDWWKMGEVMILSHFGYEATFAEIQERRVLRSVAAA